jgi:glycosyltransferase involved in cell wall biosynthesis
MPTDYTVIYLNYNQGLKLEQSINDWLSLLPDFKPKEILIIDDGSVPVPKENGIIRVVGFPHTAHMAHLANVGVDECKTDWFIYWDAGRQLTLEYIALQLHLKNKNELNIPLELNVKERGSIISKVAPSNHRVEITDSEFLPTGLSLMHKETFLYYNEVYDNGIGRHDMDYNYRWLLMGRKIYHCTSMIAIHINHERGYQTRLLISRNEYVYHIIRPLYKQHNITDLRNCRLLGIGEENEKRWREQLLPSLQANPATFLRVTHKSSSAS